MSYKILVCDDAASQRSMLCDALKKNGYAVSAQAANGEEAVRLYLEQRPDAVLLDITMPVTDGITALKEILSSDGNAVVVMLSAMGQQDKVNECLRIGAKGFAVKPFRDSDVIKALEKALL